MSTNARLMFGLVLLEAAAIHAYPTALRGMSIGELLQEELDARPWLTSGATARKRGPPISINQDSMSLTQTLERGDQQRVMAATKQLLKDIGKRGIRRDSVDRRDPTGDIIFGRYLIQERDDGVAGRSPPVGWAVKAALTSNTAQGAPQLVDDVIGELHAQRQRHLGKSIQSINNKMYSTH